MIFPRFPLRPAAALVALILLGCSGAEGGPGFDVTDRAPGVRVPLTAACDAMDTTRCLLPWPSSTYTIADPSTATGLRVHVDKAKLIAVDDDPASLNRADGFSRVTPLVVAFSADIAPIGTAERGDGPVRLFLAQPGAPSLGTAVPLRFDVRQEQLEDSRIESCVFAYPLRPLAPRSDYVAVVLDDLPVCNGAPIEPPPLVQVALGLTPPRTLVEAQLAAYHAPTRAGLGTAGIDLRRVVRVWDFTTRSDPDPQ